MKPQPAVRLRSFISPDILLVTFAAGTSVALGALVTKSPLAAAGVLLLCAGVSIALTRPRLLFTLGVLLLTVEPRKALPNGSVFSTNPETYKVLLYLCFLPLLFTRGIVVKRCTPILAYVFVTVLSEAFGTRLPGLTNSQTVSSLVSLSLGWLVFAINWDWRRDNIVLKVLALVPLTSVLLAIPLQAIGDLSVFTHQSPPRLTGATTTAWLGTFGVCGVLACLALYRRERWRWAKWLGFADVVILGASLTRGAVIALGIVAIPSAVRFARHQISTQGVTGIAKLGAALSVVAIGVALLAPGIEARNENAVVYNVARGDVTHEIASGRFEAWTFTYEQAKVNLAFGRGVGAGPIVGDIPGSPHGFTAQHNEYIRMLLEVGIVGGVILLTTMVFALGSVIRRSPPRVRADLVAGGIAFALYSITENTLSAPPLAVAFLLVFGIAGSRASSSCVLVASREVVSPPLGASAEA
jgi:hypothetical protein